MRSTPLEKSTSAVEVANISPHGFWLLLGEREVFVSFREYPWFREASIDQLTKVELPSPHHLYWPDLDADVAVESLDHPERYPLVSRARPNKRLAGAGEETGRVGKDGVRRC
jgi:hypothetical protein